MQQINISLDILPSGRQRIQALLDVMRRLGHDPDGAVWSLGVSWRGALTLSLTRQDCEYEYSTRIPFGEWRPAHWRLGYANPLLWGLVVLSKLRHSI